jgi:hypothetical protein
MSPSLDNDPARLWLGRVFQSTQLKVHQLVARKAGAVGLSALCHSGPVAPPALALNPSFCDSGHRRNPGSSLFFFQY